MVMSGRAMYFEKPSILNLIKYSPSPGQGSLPDVAILTDPKQTATPLFDLEVVVTDIYMHVK